MYHDVTKIFLHPPDNYVVAWKRGIAILSAGNVKVTPDRRVELVHGFSLQIHNATQQDAGDYSCQIATMTPIEITHTVDILGECPHFNDDKKPAAIEFVSDTAVQPVRLIDAN